MLDPHYDVFNTSRKTNRGLHRQHADLFTAASRLYRTALLRGRLSRWVGRILNRDYSLIDLNAVVQHRRIWSYRVDCAQPVVLLSIMGSENRAQDFDRFFRPVNDMHRSQWQAIAMHLMSGVVLPPVELIEICGIHFVRDGHLRVSVARALGLYSIPAQVVHVRLKQPEPWKSAEVLKPTMQLDLVTS